MRNYHLHLYFLESPVESATVGGVGVNCCTNTTVYFLTSSGQ